MHEKLIEKYAPYFSEEITENRNILDGLIISNFKIANALNSEKIEVPNWKYYMETLILKILLHSNSMVKISYGNSFDSSNDNGDRLFIDLPSLYVLSRTIIENFLTLEYIFLNSLDDEEKFFRFKLWEISGYISRQNFRAIHKEEHITKKQEEKKLIEKLKEEIEGMPLYKSLDKKKLGTLDRYGLPRIDSWHTMIEKSILKNEVFKDMYSLTSSYAHTEFLSILQIRQRNLNIKDKVTISSVISCLSMSSMINAIIISTLVNEFSPLKKTFNEFSKEVKDSIKIWNGMGTKSK